MDKVTVNYIVDYINSLPRIGCKPFDFLERNEFLRFDFYQLKKIKITDQLRNKYKERLSVYSHDYKKRIDRK